MGGNCVSETIRVLIVEDLPTDAELSEREVRKALGSCEFRRVETREEYLAALNEYRPGLIVSDFKMPQFDGLAALKLALERCPDVPFIMVTGSMNEDTAVECMKAGAWDYVIKEHVKRLGPAVRSAMERQRVRLERKQAEEKLRRSEAEYRSLFDNAIMGISQASPDGRLIRVNQAYARMYSYSTPMEMMDAVRDIGDQLYANPEDRTEVMRILAEKGVMEPREVPVVRRDGSRLVVLVSAREIRDASGNLVCYQAEHVDVTARKRAEDELRFRNLILSTQQEASIDGILVVDVDGKIVSSNRRFATMCGIPSDIIESGSDERAQQSALDRLVAPEEFLSKVKYLYANRNETSQDEIALNDGRTLDRYSAPMVGAGGKYFGRVWYFRDITARKRAEAKREELEQQLRLSQRLESVGRLAGGIAHDFNNLLSVILCCTDFAMAGVRENDHVREELLQVKKAGERAVALTRQILAFSRKQVLQPVSLNLNQIAAGVEKMLRRILGEDIDYLQVLAPDLGMVWADQGQIEQVLMNLVVNARDAMPNGGKLTIETCNVELDEEYAARHVAVKPGPYVHFAVSDTGCGMDAATQARIFEPFFTTKEKGRGTGLGLSTVYGIVKQSGGNIWVYSEPGQGTTFKIYLPRELSAKMTVTASRLAAIHTPPTGTETILLVEDEEAVRNVAKRILREAGYTVLTAATASDALLTCQAYQDKVHLLLTDVVMPQMSGRALAERLLLARPGIKVIYMSGFADDAILHHGTLAPGTHFIGKPFSAADLTKKVREVLDSGDTKPADGHEPEAKADAEVKKQSLAGEALRALPQDVLNRLRQAVIAARYDEIVVLIEILRLTDPNLATELSRMADLFDYDGMQNLLNSSTG
jgi:two-component system cell cycle sensor histidine kinase/response regulator CckA